MEFRYSKTLLNANTAGLAGGIPVRCHAESAKATTGAKRAQQDWELFVGPIDPTFHGIVASQYGLMEVAVPECKPERLEIISYASEFGFLYDDWTEFYSTDQVMAANDHMQSVFFQGLTRDRIEEAGANIREIQSRIFKEMALIDLPRARVAIRSWTEFLKEAAGRQHEYSFESFESYMIYRRRDVGEMFWFGLLTFGMELDIPQNEIAKVRELTQPCWDILALQNDICSYKKELAAASTNNASTMVNALAILARTEGWNVDRAESWCRQRIALCLDEYQQNLEAAKMNDALASDSKVYIEALGYTISGDAAWSLIAPRYQYSDQLKL